MPSIMIVEDNLVAAMELEELLEHLGYDVVAIAERGIDAVAKAKEFKPDLILMDIKLRGRMDGIVAAEKIKSELDISIVFLTGHCEEDFVQRAANVHPEGFILKPYHGGQIKAAIEIALGNHERDRKYKRSVQGETILVENAECLNALSAKAPSLTASELRVAHLVRQGFRSKEIARVLRLSEHTVSWHRKRIRKKIGPG